MAENLSNEEEDLTFLLFFSGTIFFSIDSAGELGVAGELGCRRGVGCGGVSLGVGEPRLVDPPLHFLRTHAQPKPLLFSSCVRSVEKAKLLHARNSKTSILRTGPPFVRSMIPAHTPATPLQTSVALTTYERTDVQKLDIYDVLTSAF